jgi:hydrogenase expression/formation protein HypC
MREDGRGDRLGTKTRSTIMCLAVPMTITKIEGSRAVAESRGVETVVDISLMPDIRKGDRVIIHAGFIIEKLDEEEAREIDKVWDQYLEQLDKEEQSGQAQ